MMFKPAVAEQCFAVADIVGKFEISGAAAAIADAVRQGVGEFAIGTWAPLNRVGGVVGPR